MNKNKQEKSLKKYHGQRIKNFCLHNFFYLPSPINLIKFLCFILNFNLIFKNCIIKFIKNFYYYFLKLLNYGVFFDFILICWIFLQKFFLYK